MKTQQLSRQNSASLSVSRAIEDFMLHQRVSRHTPKTLIHYRYTLGRFEAWLTEKGIESLEDVQAATIRTFMLELEPTLKPSSFHCIMRGVRALFNFLEAEDLICENPMRRIRMPKLDKAILPAFTPEELQELERHTSGKHFRDVRNRAIVYLLLDTGLRLAECASLRVGTVDLATGHLKVMGKGRKERLVRAGGKTLRALIRYLRLRGGNGEDPLWIGERGPMTIAGLAETLEKLGKRAGVHCHPHKFRRTCALMMLRSGADIFSVQHFLGHSDLEVLRRYLAQNEADVTRVHEVHSPVDRL